MFKGQKCETKLRFEEFSMPLWRLTSNWNAVKEDLGSSRQISMHSESSEAVTLRYISLCDSQVFPLTSFTDKPTPAEKCSPKE